MLSLRQNISIETRKHTVMSAIFVKEVDEAIDSGSNKTHCWENVVGVLVIVC